MKHGNLEGLFIERLSLCVSGFVEFRCKFEDEHLRLVMGGEAAEDTRKRFDLKRQEKEYLKRYR